MKVRLYIYRQSQAGSLIEANQDGAIRYIDTFETEYQSQNDLETMNLVKRAIETTAEMCDCSETIVFVEEGTK